MYRIILRYVLFYAFRIEIYSFFIESNDKMCYTFFIIEQGGIALYSVIIISREDITRMAVSGYIQRTMHEFKVEAIFSSCEDARSFLDNNPVNIVIADMCTPQDDVLALISHISESYPGTRILVVSSYGDFEQARKAIGYGVSQFLLKPLNFKELNTHLNQAKEKLDTLSIDIEFTEEDIQFFFSDLIGGMITQPEELEQRFASLPLPGDPADYAGCLMTITLKKSEVLTHWKYGREKLAASLLDGIRRTLTPYQCFHLFRSGMRYYFVILSTKGPPEFSVELLYNVLYHLLHFSCEFKVQKSFRSIRELAGFSPSRESRPAPQPPSGETADADILIQKAKTYIQTNFARDLTREEVADTVFLSPAYFSRFFKQKTGMTFIEYLTHVRMEKAAQLLATNIRISEISKRLGYQSRNRFFINFKQYSGYSPTEYRRQILCMEPGDET